MADDITVQPFTLDPDLKEVLRTLYLATEPMTQMLQEFAKLIVQIPPPSPEMQQAVIQCFNLCHELTNSEELRRIVQFQAELVEQIAEATRQILEANPDVLQNIPESAPEELSSPEVDAATLDWFEQVFPIERRAVWANVDNKNELICYALTVAGIVLPRLAIAPDASEIKDVTDTALLLFLAVVILNILISAFDKGGDKR